MVLSKSYILARPITAYWLTHMNLDKLGTDNSHIDIP